jgi:hypothetical protein
VLITTTLLCWSLIVTLQQLLAKSERDLGLLFAPNIHDLPLSRTFLYNYLPTLLAVIFSMFMSWIDLEPKRLEPYYQLSNPEGSLGKGSLLLQYHFDFLPFVPVKALKRKHWSMFWASAAVVLVTWGVVPFHFGRPGQYLVRLPTSIADVISLFAASTAVQDAEGISHLGKREQTQHLNEIGSRYGYGSYFGGAGRVHVGIEKEPFVSSRTTWFSKT